MTTKILKLKCEKCGEEFKQVVKCHDNGNIYKNEHIKKCCSIKCARSRTWSEEDKLKKSVSGKNSEKVKLSGEAKRGALITQHTHRVCPMCKNVFSGSPTTINKTYCSKRCYLDDTKCNYRKTYLNLKHTGGNGIKGYKYNMWCDSTYELVFTIYMIEHGLKFERCKLNFMYLYNGKKHKYYPDYRIGNTIIEVKGYHNKLVDIKVKSVPDEYNYVILYRENLDRMFDYVCDKYDVFENNIQSLYDNHKPKHKYVCDYCGVEYNTHYKKKNITNFCSSGCNYKFKSESMKGLQPKKIK